MAGFGLRAVLAPHPLLRYPPRRGDRIRVDFETERGQVTVLHVVQYETMRTGVWQPVARYDTAHGFVHLDLQTAAGVVKYRIAIQDSGDALTFAIEDVKTNWKAYKRQFVREDR